MYPPTGNRSGFRTDTAISNSRFGNERTLQPWAPDSADGSDGCLEGSTSGRPWDQFAENERLFGLKSDYDENIYTTAINKSHPHYKERYAAAEKKAREIERSAPATSHVAEERVMDYTGGNGPAGENEEDKYVDAGTRNRVGQANSAPQIQRCSKTGLSTTVYRSRKQIHAPGQKGPDQPIYSERRPC